MPSPIDSQQIQQWLPVVATIVVGVVTGVVSLGVAYLAHHFTALREKTKADLDRELGRRAFLRDKLEKLVECVDEYQDAANKRGLYIGHLGINSATAIDPGDSIAFDRARAIAMLYFPSLDGPMLKLSAGNLAHTNFLAAELGKITSDLARWRTESQPTYGTRSASALGDYVAAQSALTAQARQLISGELSL